MPTAVQPEKILKELANLWVDLGKQDSTDSANGVIRACSMTLLIATNNVQDSDSAAEAAAELMRLHPSRAISLSFVTEGPPLLESRVFARCWMPVGRRQQLCSEQIEIHATMDHVEDVYAAVLGLNVPDLPVILWVKSAALLLDPAFTPMLGLARTVIVDSSQIADPHTGLATINKLVQGGWRVKDLNWTRLTVWREAIAQVFENESWRNLVSEINSVTITHRESARSTDTCYLASWLKARLPNATVQLFEEGDTSGRGVKSVSLVAGVRVLRVSCGGQDRLEIDVEGMRRQVLLPPRTDQALLHEELLILGRDSTFEQTLAQTIQYCNLP